jgi:hypothetical protein
MQCKETAIALQFEEPSFVPSTFLQEEKNGR